MSGKPDLGLFMVPTNFDPIAGERKIDAPVLGPLIGGFVGLLSMEGTVILYRVIDSNWILVGAVDHGEGEVFSYGIKGEVAFPISWHRHLEEMAGREFRAYLTPFAPALMVCPHGGLVETVRNSIARLPVRDYRVGQSFPPAIP